MSDDDYTFMVGDIVVCNVTYQSGESENIEFQVLSISRHPKSRAEDILYGYRLGGKGRPARLCQLLVEKRHTVVRHVRQEVQKYEQQADE